MPSQSSFVRSRYVTAEPQCQCADPFSRRVLRVSMGTAFKLALIDSENLYDDLLRLRERYGFELIATVPDADAEPLDATVSPPRCALLLGNEAAGLAKHLVSHCDRQVTIPMRLNTDSLNVSVASGIFLHHFTRAHQ